MALAHDSFPLTALQPALGGAEGFDPTQVDPGLRIQSWEKLSIREYGEGLQRTALVKLVDNSTYVLRSTEPRRQKWDTSCDYRPPLATRVKGFNTYAGLQLADQGVYSRLLGTNQAHGFSMEHEAWATMVILREDDARQAETPRPFVEAGRSVGIGYSMGMMDLLQELTIAHLIGRKFVAAVGIDPCLAEPHNLEEELCRPIQNIVYLRDEVYALGRSLVRQFEHDRAPLKTLKRLGHFACTVSPSPKFLLNVKDKWDMLATGDAGLNLDQIPQDIATIIHFYVGSLQNDSAIYKDRLSGNLNVRAILEDGVHLTGSELEVIHGTVKKVTTALTMDEAGATAGEIADALHYPMLTKLAA